MKMHKSVTTDRVVEAAKQSMFGTESLGICLACGEDVEGMEPDARKVECTYCGEPRVYGAEELLLMTVA